MNDLQVLAESYLASAGYTFLQQREGFFIADRLGLGGLRDTWLVWVPQKLNLPEDYRRAESGLLGDFRTFIPKYPDAKYFVLTPGGGFSQNLRAEASRLGVSLTVPILFFDSPYKRELAPDYKSAISSLIEGNQSTTRVPQPFVTLADGVQSGAGDDLFAELVSDISKTQHQCLRIVVGPAGIGKSVLFAAVFNALYERFQENKRERQIFCRPVPLLPSYLHRETVLRTAQLIDEFLRSDVAAPVPHATFEWMLCNGYSTWLFDGLDELYAGDPEFFFDVLGFLTRPATRAQILLCARESLVTSSPAFTEFLEEFIGTSVPTVKIYRLESWQRRSKRIFAWIHLENRVPRIHDRDSTKIDSFLNWVEGTDSLKTLSGIPYYCGLLLEDYKQGFTKELNTDFALIDHAVVALIKREEAKKLIPADVFRPNGLTEWLDEVAFHHYVRGFAGLRADDIAVFARVVLADELSKEQQENAVISLIQFPLFKRGSEAGTVSFEHELVCEYLAARFVLRRVAADPEWAARSLSSKTYLSDSLIGRFLAAHLPSQSGALQAIAGALHHGTLLGRAFASLLQIFLLADPRSDLIKAHMIDPEGRDISYVSFIGRDLTGISFRNCNLTGTEFTNCNLQNTHFEGAYLAGTTFSKLDDNTLLGAAFESLDRFKYIVVEHKRIEDLTDAVKWVKKATNSAEEATQPCPAAQQLRILFMKFIQIDGTGKRDEMREEYLVTGRRVAGATSPQECVEAAQRFGYLTPAERPGKLRRATGDHYANMVQFVSSLRISDHLRQLLNALCDKGQCEHVPPAGKLIR